MPSIEVGTVGGGTSLPAQGAALDIMGVRGAARAEGQAPGDNAKRYEDCCIAFFFHLCESS